MKTFLIFCISIFLIVNVNSQNGRVMISEKTVVRDSSGNIYPFDVWRQLILTGSCGLKAVDSTNKNSDLIIFKYTDKERAERIEKMPRPKESLSFRTGKKIPLFNTSDINDKKVNLKKETGKIIVLNFWFINCPPCVAEIPDLNELTNSYKEKDSVLFIAVALDGAGDLKDFLNETAFNYTIVNNGKFLAQRYNIQSYPTHVVIDAGGKVYFHTSGLAINTLYWLKKSIDELLSANNLFKN